MPTITIKAIVPKDVLSVDKVRLELLNELRKSGTRLRREFGKTTATWNTEVKFDQKVSLRAGAAVDVWTDNEIYGYGNDGTPAHTITPRTAPFLQFQTGYTAKTQPRVIGSRSGGKSGPYRRAASVNHPGMEAREFDSVIAAEAEDWFPQVIQDAIDRGIQKSGGST